MTPQAFIAKWRDAALTERQGAQSHFLDLCELLGVPKPFEPERYCFERGATKTGSGRGWADVWLAGHFAWEYKRPDGDLAKALKQLMTYALALDNPPLLVVSDTRLIQVHTHFTGTPSETHSFELDDLADPAARDKLRWLFTAPEKFRPARTTAAVTEEAARKFAELAQALGRRGHDKERVARFLDRCLLCLFAEDAGLLPGRLFERLVDKSQAEPDKLGARLAELFRAMQGGGDFALEDIPWFNGGLFDEPEALPLALPEIQTLLAAARLDWQAIDPSIFGTLFERGLDPDKRSQLGAHYTDPASIARIIGPVVVEPLLAEWAATRAEIEARLTRLAEEEAAHAKEARVAEQAAIASGSRAGLDALAKRRKAFQDRTRKLRPEAQALFDGFLERLRAYRVLDPACGSGNFLYLALKALKDVEHRAGLEAEALGLQRKLGIEASPANVLGLELNPYAAELARLTVWIGELQWMLAHGYPVRRDPILQPLNHIECRDAVLDPDGGEAAWPAVDAIIGNPPFLGGSKKRGELGDDYFAALNRVYAERVPGGADLVCYWFDKARAHIEQGQARRAGLVATQAVRSGANRKVLERIVDAGRIFAAWSDEPWVNEGAAVRVSLVCFEGGASPGRAPSPQPPFLDGQPVEHIHADLTAGGAHSGGDLTTARPLAANAGRSFEGTKKYGDFDIPGSLARHWLALPNPHGRPNRDVVKPWANGQDVTGRPSDTWIIDFGVDMPEADAALYEAPFGHVLARVKPYRETVRRERTRRRWWIHEEARVALRDALAPLARFIATPRVAKHRLFVWLPVVVLPDTRLCVIARDDDTTFGILHSRLHEVWSLANASMHGVGNDPTYNAKSCFETFPFPAGLTPDLAPAAYANPATEAIAEAARRLVELRDAWLNPAEWTERVPEVVPGYPERIVPKPGCEAELKKRTLTNLYNARALGQVSWLAHAHAALDAAVARAYGWTDYTPAMPDEEILRRLLALNLARSGR
jgi:type II restriction/modification system DNA methylase subunit YeeA